MYLPAAASSRQLGPRSTAGSSPIAAADDRGATLPIVAALAEGRPGGSTIAASPGDVVDADPARAAAEEVAASGAVVSVNP